MIRTKLVLDVLIVLAFGIFISDDEADGRTQRFSFENPRKEFYLVTFFPLCSDFGLAWFSTIELCLNKVKINFQTRRATVNYSTNGGAVRFTESGEAKKCTESIASHKAAKVN